jgi:hypothetical protein
MHAWGPVSGPPTVDQLITSSSFGTMLKNLGGGGGSAVKSFITQWKQFSN